jgi:hypothetical protein
LALQGAILQQDRTKHFTSVDALFLLFLLSALIGVALIGHLAYREGLKTEAAKANAAILKDWFDQLDALSAKGQQSQLEACRDDGEKTWEGCQAALLGEQGPLKSAKNPFDPNQAVIGQKCDRTDLNTRGLVVIEKGTPAPPGAPPAVSFGPMETGEKLSKDLPLRIIVCDKGAYALKVAEVKL